MLTTSDQENNRANNSSNSSSPGNNSPFDSNQNSISNLQDNFQKQEIQCSEKQNGCNSNSEDNGNLKQSAEHCTSPDSKSSDTPDSNITNNPIQNEHMQVNTKKREKIPTTIWQIGMMMFLMNLSHVIAYSFSGLYLKHILCAATFSIAILEGICEMVSYLMKLFSGLLSDILKKRKLIMVIGYALSVTSKILLACSNTFAFVLTAKTMERFGNGTQASPRDAIVADVAPKRRIGASYGLKRSLGYAGSFLGGFAGIWLMQATNNNYQLVFLFATIPAIIAFFILVFLVKDPKKYNPDTVKQERTKEQKFSIKNVKNLGLAFFAVMALDVIFMLSRMNEQFLILRFNSAFVPDPSMAPKVMIVMNIGAVLASYPCGLLGDKLNRAKMLFIAVTFLILADFIMYSTSSLAVFYCGILCWGVQLGASQNVFYSLIAETVPANLRGTGIGIYWFINAAAIFCADWIAGAVVRSSGHLEYAFVSSGLIGVVALLILPYITYLINLHKRKNVEIQSN